MLRVFNYTKRMAKKTNNAEFKKIKIDKLIPNPDNPRFITEENFNRLMKSIDTLPKMLEIRPIVVNEDMMVIGGNQRLEAMRELGYTEAHVVVAKGWTAKELEQYVIVDNTHFGQWAWSMLDEDNKEELAELGVEIEQWEDLSFKPILNPSSSNNEVTPSDIEKQKAMLNNSISLQTQVNKEIVCPHCLEVFEISHG